MSSKTSWYGWSARLLCCASGRCTRPSRCNPRNRRQPRRVSPLPRRVVSPLPAPRRRPRHQPASHTPPASPGPRGQGNNKPLPALPTAPPVPVDKACVPADGKGTPPDKALDWQPTQACQAAFAEFTCETKVTEVADQGLFACNQEKTEKYLLGPTLIEGNQLASAVAGIPQNNVNWVVNLEFNSEGAAAFETATRELSQKSDPQNRFAIVLDGVSISAPSVNEAIPGGRAEISGNFTQKSATELANVLKYGALPLAFDVSEVNNVSATLGGDQLRAGIIAGIIGLALVVGYCFWYYRGLGIVVVASLGIAA